jgi:hypothetical protein
VGDEGGGYEPAEDQVRLVPASDPFFGATGRLMRATRREQQLKFELEAELRGIGALAVMSFNCHKDAFAELFEIRARDGSTAHTSCVGFGIERIALSLFHAHGLDLRDWPAHVRALLQL